jgi:hypothetical protein
MLSPYTQILIGRVVLAGAGKEKIAEPELLATGAL